MIPSVKSLRLIICLFTLPFLSGCLNTVWTGANLIYDRHHVYKKINDFNLVANARRVLFKDEYFKQQGCVLDFAAFNGTLLVAGHLPSKYLRNLAYERIVSQGGYLRFFNQISVGNANDADNTIEDSWLSAKIRAQILTDSSLDPNAFKIITVDRIVYILGDVLPNQGTKILHIASSTHGVLRVVNLLQYFRLIPSTRRQS